MPNDDLTECHGAMSCAQRDDMQQQQNRQIFIVRDFCADFDGYSDDASRGGLPATRVSSSHVIEARVDDQSRCWANFRLRLPLRLPAGYDCRYIETAGSINNMGKDPDCVVFTL